MSTEQLIDDLAGKFTLYGVNIPVWKSRIIDSLREVQRGFLIKSLNADKKIDKHLFEQIATYLMWMIFSFENVTTPEQIKALYEESKQEDERLWKELKSPLRWVWRKSLWQERVCMAESYSILINHLEDSEFRKSERKFKKKVRRKYR